MNLTMPSRSIPMMMKNSGVLDCSIRPGNEEMNQAKPMQKEQRLSRTLTRLIARQKWLETERVLASSNWISIDEKGLITDESILQFALRYRVPLHIVKILASRYPRCLTRPDSTGKFCCHVAAKYGATPNVMDFLVSMNKHAAGVQDPEGKAPIHYVAEFYACNHESGVPMTVNEHMIQVVR
mmetsp:Transcript_20068/g.34538  ORF Transcript_20068/g.34538 Transcript_20068/m.34538 type:complete len:182 (+) Transcript_20068:83-628(+)